MTLPHDLIAGLTAGPDSRPLLPEYRQIELYTKRKSLSFAAPEPPLEVPMPRIASVCRAFMVLDAVLEGQSLWSETVSSWQRYLALPRATMTDKVAAELYRILRVARAVLFHSQGHLEMEDGIVKVNGAINKIALSLEITPAGLRLLDSATAYYLESLSQPYPEPYVGAMLAQYYCDIVAEIRRFADEDRVLYQFRPPLALNRHFRFDCDNPKLRMLEGLLEIEIGPRYRDPARYPIDFFVTTLDTLHILPVEALIESRIALTELPLWRIRSPDGLSLPASFRQRFGREVMVVGQPMT